jgi:hypothetical protein
MLKGASRIVTGCCPKDGGDKNKLTIMTRRKGGQRFKCGLFKSAFTPTAQIALR